jgi:hypothetical protein
MRCAARWAADTKERIRMDIDIATPRLEDADGFYAELLQAHEGLTDAQSALLNSKLVFLLANQVGAAAVLSACVAAAREDVA